MPGPPVARRRTPGTPKTPDEAGASDLLSRISTVRTSRPAHIRDGMEWSEIVGGEFRRYSARKRGDEVLIGYSILMVEP